MIGVRLITLPEDETDPGPAEGSTSGGAIPGPITGVDTKLDEGPGRDAGRAAPAGGSQADPGAETEDPVACCRLSLA